jgi:cytosine/adenosine deaminase-related metal-dependent hydrolase
VFSHASFLTYQELQLLEKANQYISITPESEMHFGHTHPHSHLATDQAALGVDTHFTFSADILTQARIWLQKVRYLIFNGPLELWRVPSNNPMSVNQAFLLATRNGGLALRRPDLGVITEGAKADLLVWDGTSPSMLGWNDPVAAVILHASVGDIEHVLVDGKFVKRDGKLTNTDYPAIKDKFLQSAKRIQSVFLERPRPVPEKGEHFGGENAGGELMEVVQVDVLRGDGSGYGVEFLDGSKP